MEFIMEDKTRSHDGITLSRLKEQARALKRERADISHRQALDLLARQHGFPNWDAATRRLDPGQTDPKPKRSVSTGPSSGSAATETTKQSSTASHVRPNAAHSPTAAIPPHGCGPRFLEESERSHLLDVGQQLPDDGRPAIEVLLDHALSMAAHSYNSKRSGSVRLLGFNVLMLRTDGSLLDGGFNSALLIKPNGRDWAGRQFRRWIFENNVDRVVISTDMRPESKKGMPDQFAIIAMEPGRCLIRLYAYEQLLSRVKPRPQIESAGDGYWYDCFKMAQAEREIGEMFPEVDASKFKLL